MVQFCYFLQIIYDIDHDRKIPKVARIEWESKIEFSLFRLQYKYQNEFRSPRALIILENIFLTFLGSIKDWEKWPKALENSWRPYGGFWRELGFYFRLNWKNKWENVYMRRGNQIFGHEGLFRVDLLS